MKHVQTSHPQWLHWLTTCPSTNRWTIENAAALHHGDVVFTQNQTAGRGQGDRTWHSPTGVLTASFVLDQIPPMQLPALSLAAGLAVIYAVEDLVPICQGTLRLKWPNDVLIDGRKLAGILCEASLTRTKGRVVVGVGLNRCVNFLGEGLEDIVHRSISLHQVRPLPKLNLPDRSVGAQDLAPLQDNHLTAHVPTELELLERLRHYLLEAAGLLRFQATQSVNGLGALLPALRSRDALVGRAIAIETAHKTITGEAAGIGDRGHLLLRLPNGEIREFASGHILGAID